MDQYEFHFMALHDAYPDVGLKFYSFAQLSRMCTHKTLLHDTTHDTQHTTEHMTSTQRSSLIVFLLLHFFR